MIKRPNGTWEERFTDSATGKRKSIYGKTKAEVKRKLAEYQNRREKGITVNEGLDLWLEAKRKEVSYKTYEGYQAPVKRIREQFGEAYANTVTPVQVQAFVNGIAARGYKRTTVQRPLDVLRMLYDFMITTEGSGVRENPTIGVRMPKNLKQESRDLAPREAIEIIKANVTAHPFGLYPFMQMYSGLRDQELLALTDKDIDRENMIISVNKAISWQTNKPIIKETKTVNGVRKVVLLSPLAAVLPKFHGYLFSADGGKSPLTNTEFRRRWDGYCRDVGLATCEIVTHHSAGKNNRTYERKLWHNTIVPYQLRHEFATLCYDAGLDPKDAADMMGHSSEELTRKWYTHIKEQRRQQSHDKLEAFVNQGQTV